MFQRYIEVRDDKLYYEFVDLYSEHMAKFTTMENNLTTFINELTSEYKNRLERKFKQVDKVKDDILRLISDYYFRLNRNRKVPIFPAYDDIAYFINEYRNTNAKGTFKIAKLLLPTVQFPARISGIVHDTSIHLKKKFVTLFFIFLY